MKLVTFAQVWSVIALSIAATALAQETKPSAASPAAGAGAASAAKQPDLIPRAVLFGNPEKASAQISPDGSKVSFLAPVKGVLNIWVGPSGRIADAKPVTGDEKRGIRRYLWAYTSQHVVYLQDVGGDENWRVYCTDLATGKTLTLTPMDGIAAQIVASSPRFPDEIIVGINNRNPQYHDLHRVNIRTGEMRLVQENEGFVNFTIDDDYRVRFGQKPLPGGGIEEFRAVERDGKIAWESWAKIPIEDVESYAHIDFDTTGDVRYIRDAAGRDTAAIVAVKISTGERQELFGHDKADAGEVLVHPTEKTIQAVEHDYDRPRWNLNDPALVPDWQHIAKTSANGAVRIPSRSHDDRFWIVTVDNDNASARTYIYDRGLPPGGPASSGGGATGAQPKRGEQKMTLLFVQRPALQGRTLAGMKATEIRTRDGLTMMCYLSLPPGSDTIKKGTPDRPLPMVLNVHGGPWARDSWGFDPEHQWLANRGYAVLSVNYRGSTGFGKKFVSASKREWGGKMHDDLIDAVNWAIENKVADPQKVAIYGGSYGGYAALAGLTFTPEVFACGVDIVGVSNLTTFMDTIPPYWKPMVPYFYGMIGDPTTEEGRRFLLERSPVTKADRIVRPLLIAQGANDPRVNKAESDQIVKALQEKKIPVTYAVYPDEGHGFARPANRQSFYAVAEAFLAQHLGGRFEPIGEDFRGSSIVVETGAEQIPGLSEAAGSAK